MLTLSETYKVKSLQSNEHDWLLQLYYDDGTNFTAFSGGDRTVDGIYYRGLVTNFGSINEKIDLTKSKATISNLSITLANIYPNSDKLLSSELWQATRKYFNRKVVVYQWIEGVTALTDLSQIFEGRLNDATYDERSVTLNIEHRVPWDRIRIPNELATITRKYFPVVYGSYFSRLGSKILPAAQVWPSPISERTNNHFVCLTHKIDSNDAGLLYFEEGLDDFMLLDDENTATFVYQDGNATSASINLARTFSFVPTVGSIGNLTSGSDQNQWTGSEFALNEVSLTFAVSSGSFSTDTGGDNIKSAVYYNWPRLDHFHTVISGSYNYAHQIVADANTNVCISFLIDDTFDGDKAVSRGVSLGIGGGIDTDSTDRSEGIDANYVGDPPNNIRLSVNTLLVALAGTATADITLKLKTLDYRVTSVISGSEQNTIASQALAVETLYCASNGYTNSYDGGFGLSTKPHEIYRDMLKRFTGFDVSDSSITVNGLDWLGQLGADRNWAMNWWALEPVDLSAVLTQLQFEGGFVWLQEESGAKIIYVQDSYSSTNFELNQDDLNNIKVSHTPFDAIVSTYNFNWSKHPAKDTYRKNNSKTNTNRSDWQFNVSENVVDVDLDFHSDEANVILMLDYYDNITGDVKVILSANVVGPIRHAIEIGDTIQFDNSNMPYNAFGFEWTDKVFMCVGIQKTLAKTNITCREVGVIT